MRGLILAITAAALLLALAVTTFGIEQTLTVIVAGTAIAGGAFMMHHPTEGA
ncbi:hypothetical protein [Curtobacterium sp. MCSS17_016]|uniref:hypothetical protein n=1 Tax=Curtobacterium sp. MCSS17_016 TaxID=2175644 RepID=UPI0015E8CF60|nr:hypothetical protein [Curtobacterium sp. MCSS17_016]WIE81112.1 hypothetical protein DEJ19_021795 [Curtobacterium sp. MCSS17_016]